MEVRGIALPPHYGGLSLQQLVAGEALPPLRLTAPALADLPNGPGRRWGACAWPCCWSPISSGRYVVMIQAPSEHQPSLQIEVAGLPVDLAQRLLAELDQLRADLNVYRGHLLDVSLNPMGGVILTFAGPPGISQDDVVLPATVLARIERHALGVAAHREALLAAGQHLKRGLLLYGPPGTGKTHTTRYLLGQMTSYTRLVLTGRSLVAVGAVTDLARALLPAVVVLEDVDLVAEERSLGPASSPVLFDLLDAMDGAAPDADLLFLLTTNRADLLEPALAARPGRVDVAVEIALPDAPARERLLTLYGRNVPAGADRRGCEPRRRAHRRHHGLFPQGTDPAQRAGVTARRPGAHRGHRSAPGPRARRPARRGQAVTRTLLGVGVDPADLPAGGALSPGPGRSGAWMAYGRRATGRRFVHYGGCSRACHGPRPFFVISAGAACPAARSCWPAPGPHSHASWPHARRP